MARNVVIHLIHIPSLIVANSRINIISRGVTNDRVTKRIPMLDFLSINQSIIDKISGLIPSMKSWWLNDETLDHLSPNDWYIKEFAKKRIIWNLPPVVVDVALEKLYRNIHLYNLGLHIVCLPRLMTSRWSNKLLKVSYFGVAMKFDENDWPQRNFESLILVIV